MAKMPLGQPRSVPDPAGEQYDRMIAQQRARQPVAQRPAVDSQRTEVFRRGPDGKLHPIPGWTTTGPFDFKTWARNVDWPNTARDLAAIAAGVTGWLVPGAWDGFAKAGIAGNLYNSGNETLEELEEIDAKSRR